MRSRRFTALSAALLATALVLAPAAGASAAAGSWTYPDSKYPDFPYGSWDRESDGVNIGRGGYLFQACDPSITLGFNSTNLNVDFGFVGTFSGAAFTLYLSVPDPSTGPYPGQEPQDWEYDTVEDFQAALAAWNVANAAYHPTLYTRFVEGPTSTTSGQHAQATLTIPAEALAYGSALEIHAAIYPLYATIDPNYPNPASPFTLNGTVIPEDVAALTCDRNGSAPGVGTPGGGTDGGGPGGTGSTPGGGSTSGTADVSMTGATAKSSSGETLAATGTQAAASLPLAAIILGLGALAFVVSRRRIRA